MFDLNSRASSCTKMEDLCSYMYAVVSLTTTNGLCVVKDTKQALCRREITCISDQFKISSCETSARNTKLTMKF